MYTKYLSRDSLNLQSTSSGRLETMASAPISPNSPGTTKSPLFRPSSESLLEKSSPDGLHCTSPEGAQMASSQGLKTPSKSPGTSCLYESPRRTSSRLTPAKRLISDSSLLESPSKPPKSPKTVAPPVNAYGSPRRPSTRSLAPDLNAASVGSPRKLPKSPAKSPRKLPKSPAKSPRKLLNSPAKTFSEGGSPRRMLLKSPEKKSIDSEGQQSQQAMTRSDLRR